MSTEPRGWRSPTVEETKSKLFNLIWGVTKSWDVNVPEQYQGYCGLNGNHVITILEAIKPEYQALEQKLAVAVEALEFYASGAKKIIEVGGKKHWIKEFGCQCCSTSYDVDEDGSIGCGNYDVEDVAGMTAREALALIKPDAQKAGET